MESLAEPAQTVPQVTRGRGSPHLPHPPPHPIPESPVPPSHTCSCTCTFYKYLRNAPWWWHRAHRRRNSAATQPAREYILSVEMVLSSNSSFFGPLPPAFCPLEIPPERSPRLSLMTEVFKSGTHSPTHSGIRCYAHPLPWFQASSLVPVGLGDLPNMSPHRIFTE